MEASPLIGGDDAEIAVAIEPAAGDQLIGLLLAAYGMSTRERQICREVIAGPSTTDIAGRLFVSPNTVQDHLKSIFGKVGVRSRGELVARLRPGGVEPEKVDTDAAAVWVPSQSRSLITIDCSLDGPTPIPEIGAPHRSSRRLT